MKPRRPNLIFLLPLPFFLCAAITGFQPQNVMPGIMMLLIAVVAQDVARRKDGGERRIPWMAIGISALAVGMTAFVWLTLDVHWLKQSMTVSKWTVGIGTLFCVAYTTWYGVTGKRLSW